MEQREYDREYAILSSVRRFFLPDCDHVALTDVLYALSDPTRLQIVAALAECSEQTCSAGPLASIPKSTLAHHFKVLRETGVITTRAEGTQSVNSLRRADLDMRFPGLIDAVLNAVRICPFLPVRDGNEKSPGP